MNMNALLGIIGLSLLAFVAAFAIGRLNRPMPDSVAKPSTQQVSVSRNEPRPAATGLPMTTTDSVATTRPAQGSATNTPSLESAADSASTLDVAADKPTAPAPPTAVRIVRAPAPPSAAEIAAAKQRAAETRLEIAARRAHADQLPDDFKKYYAQELPEDAISKELDVRASVAGAQADVITLTSPAFNAANKDFVIQQVRSELTELGFKQVYITDGKGFMTKVRF
ncbi:hypothetical protein SAMN00120144_1795 [Hymenobacter roseosalivarius DSM 11622]|uniref:Uncharacterized protein n=1 Tax=Hymenobacter roseosalivarius DSM 11622 TaxID=645990 RepID=A0A1W1VZL2_9BACT|nr:hypothetical protein [Hymenobacter roseosalivarius]SMB98797.1 hypothetical protein SAMN00120144_1795 [Hymenobacter roseosalivarius DSM 11622]